jgi:hypothetical protein
MKTKFLLVLITLNGLLLGANSASAATTHSANNQNVSNLSQTISELIDLNDNSLVEAAINRALLAKNVQVNEKGGTPSQPQLINGIIIKDPPPVINGRIGKPPLVNGTIIRDIQPIINGRIVRPTLINGVIAHPNQR